MNISTSIRNLLTTLAVCLVTTVLADVALGQKTGGFRMKRIQLLNQAQSKTTTAGTKQSRQTSSETGKPQISQNQQSRSHVTPTTGKSFNNPSVFPTVSSSTFRGHFQNRIKTRPRQTLQNSLTPVTSSQNKLPKLDPNQSTNWQHFGSTKKQSSQRTVAFQNSNLFQSMKRNATSNLKSSNTRLPQSGSQFGGGVVNATLPGGNDQRFNHINKLIDQDKFSQLTKSLPDAESRILRDSVISDAIPGSNPFPERRMDVELNVPNPADEDAFNNYNKDIDSWNTGSFQDLVTQSRSGGDRNSQAMDGVDEKSGAWAAVGEFLSNFVRKPSASGTGGGAVVGPAIGVMTANTDSPEDKKNEFRGFVSGDRQSEHGTGNTEAIKEMKRLDEEEGNQPKKDHRNPVQQRWDNIKQKVGQTVTEIKNAVVGEDEDDTNDDTNSGQGGNGDNDDTRPAPDAGQEDWTLNPATKAEMERHFAEVQSGLVNAGPDGGQKLPSRDELLNANRSNTNPRQGWAINPGPGGYNEQVDTDVEKIKAKFKNGVADPPKPGGDNGPGIHGGDRPDPSNPPSPTPGGVQPGTGGQQASWLDLIK